MPTFRHNFVIELFRNSGELARELLRDQVELPPGELISEALPTDFSQVVPTEYRADHVTAYHREGSRGEPPAFAIIVEVQHRIDEGKRWSWLAYVANAAARFRCPVMLLVVTWDHHVVAWARGPFSTGQPGFELRPFAIDLSELPTLLEPGMALRLPELAVLCALAHPNAASAKAAIAALRELPSDRAALYSRSITDALSPIEALILEKQMIEAPDVDYYFKIFPNLCEHIRQHLKKGVIEEVQAEVREKVQAEVREEARLIALQEAAIELVRAKLGEVPPAEKAAIHELQDTGVLTALLVELGLADGAEKVLAAIAHAATRH